MSRPLNKRHMRYAATDAYLIGLLFADFVWKGYIDEDKLLAQTKRYMTFHTSKGPRPANNTGHPLLPLDILTPPARAPLLVCGTCSRSLSFGCFPKASRGAASGRTCWVCRALDARRTGQRPAEEQRLQQDKGKKRQPGQTRQQHDPPHQHGQQRKTIPKPYNGPPPPVKGQSKISRSKRSKGVVGESSNSAYGFFGWDGEDTPGGTYYMGMYDIYY